MGDLRLLNVETEFEKSFSLISHSQAEKIVKAEFSNSIQVDLKSQPVKKS